MLLESPHTMKIIVTILKTDHYYIGNSTKYLTENIGRDLDNCNIFDKKVNQGFIKPE